MRISPRLLLMLLTQLLLIIKFELEVPQLLRLAHFPRLVAAPIIALGALRSKML